MTTSAKHLLAALALIACGDASAQMFKCTDAAGKVTYSSVKCSDLKLQDAGEIQNRIQITPAPGNQPPAARSSERNDREEPAPKPAATGEPEKQPDRRCFTITIAGGKTATRCNDKPGEE